MFVFRTVSDRPEVTSPATVYKYPESNTSNFADIHFFTNMLPLKSFGATNEGATGKECIYFFFSDSNSEVLEKLGLLEIGGTFRGS